MVGLNHCDVSNQSSQCSSLNIALFFSVFPELILCFPFSSNARLIQNEQAVNNYMVINSLFISYNVVIRSRKTIVRRPTN